MNAPTLAERFAQVLKEAPRIQSLSHFNAKVSEAHDSFGEGRTRRPRVWFRGHQDARWRLTPLGLRQPFANQSLHDKAHLFVEFKRRGIGLVDPAPRTDWGWLYLAQHHGLPTSLLDWTESSHIALFFALKRAAGQIRERQDACVWILNPGGVNERGWGFSNVVVVGDEDKEARGLLNPYLHGKPAQWKVDGDEPPLLAIIPEHVSPRLRAQRGAFVAFGNYEDALDQIVVDESPDHPGTSIARPFVIEYNAARRIERELDVSGITESEVFPDLDGLCAELARRHDTGTP